MSRGFSLVELLVAVAISSVLLVVSMSLEFGSVQAFNQTASFTALSQDAFLITEYLRRNVLAAGGANIAPFQGIWVEDNCKARAGLVDCAQSDRITVSSVSIPVQQCAVDSVIDATHIKIAVAAGTTCCLAPALPPLVSFNQRQVMLLLNGNFSQRYISNVDAGTCIATVAAGQAMANPLDASQLAPPFNAWGGATLTLVDVLTLYWDPNTNTLNNFRDTNGNGAVDAGETNLLADQIFDFQVSLGYDFNPLDGTISETADGVNDEWLYNAPGEAPNLGYFAVKWTPSQLMMVQLGVVLGVPSTTATYAPTLPLFNGPPKQINNWNFRLASTRIAPRNTMIYQ